MISKSITCAKVLLKDFSFAQFSIEKTSSGNVRFNHEKFLFDFQSLRLNVEESNTGNSDKTYYGQCSVSVV